MRIALISDSPELPTGFARSARTLADSLVAARHEVVCFGIGASDQYVDRHALHYRVWPAGDGHADVDPKVRAFLETEQPHVILLNFDLVRSLVWIERIASIRPSTPVVCHLVVDGLPVDETFLKPLAGVSAIAVPSSLVAGSIRRYVNCPVYHFPHLVNGEVFFPVVGRERLAKTPLVVGCIARNHPRKQLQQLLIAIRQLQLDGFECRLRLHTDSLNASQVGGDNLRRIVRALKLEDSISVSEHGYQGTPGKGPADADIAKLIRECDCMAVVPTCGGFEYGIIEAQACGVPVIVTKDAGVLEEISGQAAYLVRPTMFDFTSYGAHAFRVPSSEIALAIRALASDNALRVSLVDAGLRNAALYQLRNRQHEFANIMSRTFSEGDGHAGKGSIG